MTKRFHFVLLATVIILTMLFSSFSCVKKKQTDNEIIGVGVSILPQAEFAENIGGDMIDITVMVPTGADPHTYEPRPSQMVSLNKAKIYTKLGSGLEFELTYLDKIIAVNKNMLIVDCSKGVDLIASQEPDEPGSDPHIWLSPLNAKKIVRNICDGLVQVDPANKSYYEVNRDAYLRQLDNLHYEIMNSLSKTTDRNFMVYHPSFSYFARDYNLTQLSIEESGKEPTAASIAALIEKAKQNNIKVIFASTQFNPQSARAIASGIGGRVVFIDPLAKDYIANLRTMLSEMVAAMK